MNITQIPEGFALYKEKDEIGRCALTPTPKGGTFGAFCILPQWRRKGYGSYLLKEILRPAGPRRLRPGTGHRLYRSPAHRPGRGGILGQI